MEHFVRDLRYAMRMLAVHPGFTIVATLSLALGIGANSTIFSAVNTVLLRPLPFEAPDRLVRLYERYLPKGTRLDVSPRNLEDWREQSRAFESFALMTGSRMRLSEGEQEQRIQVYRVSDGFFSLLGAPLILGRAFLPEDVGRGGKRVVVLSHRLWVSRFGADQFITDSEALLDGQSHRIIGVAPPQLSLLDEGVEAWIPLRSNGARYSRDQREFQVLARIRSGFSLPEARTELEAAAQRLELEFPESNQGWGVSVIPLRQDLLGESSHMLLLLLGAVGFVLLIACANVANLLLARSSRREKEIALRAALGARRRRLIAQLFTENLVLAVAGGALGILIALWGIDMLVGLYAGWLPRADQMSIDLSVAGFTVLTSLATAMIFGVLPALKSSRPDLIASLKDAGTSTASSSDVRLRGLLAVSEIALALVLLIGAGLMIKSYSTIESRDPGYDSENVLTLELDLPDSRYRSPFRQRRFFQSLTNRISNLRGVESVAITDALPAASPRASKVVFPQFADSESREVAECYSVSQDYFRTLGIPLLQGHDFSPSDFSNRRRVAVISRSLAERFWGQQDPLGKQFQIRDRRGSWEVVGVSGDVWRRPAAEASLSIYLPFSRPSNGTYLVVRSESDPASLFALVRKQVWALDSSQPIDRLATLEETTLPIRTQQRFYMLLLSCFALMAVLMAAVGIFGVLTFVVSERLHEIGIRMAFGARRRDVARRIVGHGLGLSTLGILVGVLLATGATRFLSGLLYDIRATDPATYLMYSLVLAAVALLACSIPALRATRVNPIKTLRYE